MPQTTGRQLIDVSTHELPLEDMRPDSIDRSVMIVGSIGSTRTSDLRDTRRRVLDNERKGVESLYNQTSASRARLEEDVRRSQPAGSDVHPGAGVERDHCCDYHACQRTQSGGCGRGSGTSRTV